MTYDETSISILSADQAEDRFDWLKVETLSRQYHRPVEWIKRGFSACRQVGVSPDYFIAKYLTKDGTPERPEVTEAFKHLLNEMRP